MEAPDKPGISRRGQSALKPMVSRFVIYVTLRIRSLLNTMDIAFPGRPAPPPNQMAGRTDPVELRG
jgi:hypothetical protein